MESWKSNRHNENKIAQAASAAISSRKFRDASPVEKINIRIENTKLLNSFGYKKFDVASLISERDALIASAQNPTAIEPENVGNVAFAFNHNPPRNYNPIIDAWECADDENRRELMEYLQRQGPSNRR